jgi:hypothetical protein
MSPTLISGHEAVIVEGWMESSFSFHLLLFLVKNDSLFQKAKPYIYTLAGTFLNFNGEYQFDAKNNDEN